MLGNTVTQVEPIPTTSEPTSGIRVADGGSAAVRDNAVTGYLAGAPGQADCGILIAAGATVVELSGNAFPPPGNEQDLCDGRAPQPAASPVPATPVAQ